MSKVATIEDVLSGFFDSAQDGLQDELPAEEYETRRRDFVFHLMDPKEDLERLVHLLNHGETGSDRDPTLELMGILYHIIPHLRAAGRLLLDEIPDGFNP